MVTKESLIRDREEAKVAFLRLKQLYKSSAHDIYLIVEGKDDFAYYTCVCNRYPKLLDAKIIPANNRRNVINTFQELDWTTYSKDRVFFFIDRDLSEITHEATPESPNVYVSDSYSIENSLFDVTLLITAIKVHCGVVDLLDEEATQIASLYNSAFAQFEHFFVPIMSWILSWRINGQKCNLNNFNAGLLYRINCGNFEVNEEYQIQEKVIKYIHSKCDVDYVCKDITPFSRMIEQHGGIEKCIRGKYVKTFFVKFFNSIRENFTSLFPDRTIPKNVVAMGNSNALQILCGYMIIPESLTVFLQRNSII